MNTNWLIGDAGYAFLDYWFAAHLGFWFTTGSSITAIRFDRLRCGLVCMVLALLWEVFERFAEKQWPAIWQSPESWWNAWLSDPLTVIIGLAMAYAGYDYGRGNHDYSRRL